MIQDISPWKMCPCGRPDDLLAYPAATRIVAITSLEQRAAKRSTVCRTIFSNTGVLRAPGSSLFPVGRGPPNRLTNLCALGCEFFVDYCGHTD